MSVITIENTFTAGHITLTTDLYNGYVETTNLFPIKTSSSAYANLGSSSRHWNIGYINVLSSNTLRVDTISGTYSLARPVNYHLRFNEKINLTSTTSLVFGAGDNMSTNTGKTLKGIIDDITTSINNITNFKVSNGGIVFLASGHTYLVIKKASNTNSTATFNIYSGNNSTISGDLIYTEI